MSHRTPSLKQLLSGMVLTAAGTGFLLSGCAHGPSRSFQAIWEPDGAIRRAASRIASFGRTEDSTPTALAAADAGAGSEVAGREQVETVAFNPLKDPFLNDPLRASSTGYPGGSVPQVAAAPRERNPFEAVAAAETPAVTQTLQQAGTSGGQQEDVRRLVEEDTRFAGGFDSQLERLRNSLRSDLNSTSPAAEIDSSRVARTRIDTMMQQARQQIDEGQLEAALATVEQANQLAEQDAVFFGPNEVRPTDMLRDVRERMAAGTQLAAAGTGVPTTTGGLLPNRTTTGTAAQSSEVVPLLPRRAEWAEEPVAEEPVADITAQNREPKPSTVVETVEQAPAKLPELSFRPASEFVDQEVSGPAIPETKKPAEQDDLPPASSGPALGATSNSPVEDNPVQEKQAASAPAGGKLATVRENVARPLPLVPHSETGTEGARGSGSTTRELPRPTTSTGQPVRLPALPGPATAAAKGPEAGTQIAAVTETARGLVPGWSVWEGSGSKPAARAVPAMPAHLGWKQAVEPQPTGVQSAHGGDLGERAASTRSEGADHHGQLQPLSAEMGGSPRLARIGAAELPTSGNEPRLEGHPGPAGSKETNTVVATSVPRTENAEADQSVSALPAGPLPEIFNVKTISQEEARADARNRKKSTLPSGLVIGILLGLVAVAIGWHRLSTWSRSRRRTMA